jgi:hypothetical protein
MKSKKGFIGLIAGMVVLSGSTLLYLAGVERVGVTPALATPPGGGQGDCPVGAFCGKEVGQGGACTYVPCCPEGQAYCFLEERVGYPFRKVMADAKGSCWEFKAPAEPYCKETTCVGGVCPSGCTATGTQEILERYPPRPIGGQCLPKE